MCCNLFILAKFPDSGDWDQANISEIEFRELLNAKIDAVNFQRIKDDIPCSLATHAFQPSTKT